MNIIHCSITTPSQTLREPGNLFVSYTAYQGQIYLTISLKAASPSQQFSVNIEMNRDSSSIAMPDSSSVVFSAFSQSFPVALSIDQRDLDFGAQMGNTIGGLVNLNPTREKSYGGLSEALFMLDPSGTLSRFSQVLKIISRLAYFNFPFGQKLVLFLEHAESLSGVDKVTGDEEIKLSRVGTRAKLTRYKVGVEVMNTIYTWKTGLYAFSGLVTLILGIYRLYRRETHKYVLYLMYVWPRVHLILFNYTIVDISFMATRVLLHSRLGLHCFYSLILLCMIFFDICRIIQLALNDRLWKLIYKQKAEEDARLCPRTVSPQNIIVTKSQAKAITYVNEEIQANQIY